MDQRGHERPVTRFWIGNVEALPVLEKPWQVPDLVNRNRSMNILYERTRDRADGASVRLVRNDG